MVFYLFGTGTLVLYDALYALRFCAAPRQQARRIRDGTAQRAMVHGIEAHGRNVPCLHML
eukprot:477867-Pleurochrysis_carterae.AAC.1